MTRCSVKAGIAIAIIICLTGCAHLNQTSHSKVKSSLASKQQFEPKQADQIKVAQSTDQPYLVVGQVYVKNSSHFGMHKHSNNQIKQLMKQRAAQLGGDAVIKLHHNQDKHVGTVIRYL